MTREQLKLKWMNEFKMIISNKVIYRVKDEYLTMKFDEFYANLTKVVKVSNLDEANFIFTSKEEDTYSVAVDTKLWMMMEGIPHIEMKAHFFIVKTSKYVEYTVFGNEIGYLPEKLGA